MRISFPFAGFLCLPLHSSFIIPHLHSRKLKRLFSYVKRSNQHQQEKSESAFKSHSWTEVTVRRGGLQEWTHKMELRGSRTWGRMKLRSWEAKTRNARRKGEWWRDVLGAPAEKKQVGKWSQEGGIQESRSGDSHRELGEARDGSSLSSPESTWPCRHLDFDFRPPELESMHCCCLKLPGAW